MKKIGAFLTILVSLAFSTAHAQNQFPALTVENLNGRSVDFPQGLPADPTIVFIAYTQEHQGDLAAWIDALGLLPNGGQAWVEFPVIGRGGALVRGFINNGMRSGIESVSIRDKVFTVYSSRGAFNRAIGISGVKQVFTALVGQDGTIHVLIEGPVTPEKIAQLRAAYP